MELSMAIPRAGTMEADNPPGGGSVEWARAWLPGRLDAARASALTVAGCAAGGLSFRGAELYVASGGAEDDPASRALRLAAQGFAADGQCPLDIRGADAIVGHESD